MNEGMRLHPISWLFIIIEFIRHFFFPLLVALLAGGGEFYETYGVFFIIPGVLFALLQYWVYRYQLNQNEIVVREGVLFKNVRHVPWERIQNLNLKRNPLHRLFGVAQLELESASGGKPEAVMRVVSLAAVEEIRQKLIEIKSQDDGADNVSSDESMEIDDQSSVLKIPLTELVKAGLISNKGMLVVAAVFGLLAQTGSMERFFEHVEDWAMPLMDSLAIDTSSPVSYALLVVLGIIAFIVAIRILSIIFMITTYYGFDLKLNAKKLVADYGLITRLHATLPQQRIQLVSFTQNWLHQKFRRAAIRVATAGGGYAHNSQQSTKLRWVAPIIESEKTESLIQRIQPTLSMTVDQWHPVAFRAWKRVARLYGVLLTMILAPLAVLVSEYFIFAFALLGWVFIYARKTVSSMRYGLSKNAIIFESGWLVKHRTYVLLSKIQSLSLSQNPLDRRAGMATLVADVAGLESQRHYIHIPYLEKKEAEQWMDDLYSRICATEYQWR